jgi:hypothetical protein
MPARQFYWMMGFQVVIYVAIKNLIASAFADQSGESFYIFFQHNLRYYWTHPALVVLILAITAILLIFISKNWNHKPLFLRMALIILLPVQILLHLILGYEFEMRVYIEIFPIVLLLATPLMIQYPAWILCPEECGELYCTIHSDHVCNCPCPEINEWDIDPFYAGGNPI